MTRAQRMHRPGNGSADAGGGLAATDARAGTPRRHVFRSGAVPRLMIAT